MRTHSEVAEQAKSINCTIPGIPSVTRMLALVLEVLLDIREKVAPDQS